MNNSGGQLFNWLSGITLIVIVGIITSNAAGVAGILNGMGNLYKAAASAAHPAK